MRETRTFSYLRRLQISRKVQRGTMKIHEIKRAVAAREEHCNRAVIIMDLQSSAAAGLQTLCLRAAFCS
jgi:hypothetical protein